MVSILKFCKKHGPLIEGQVKWEKSGKKSGTTLRCIQCKIEKDQKWKKNNREKHIAASIRWKKNNRQRVNEWAKEDRLKNPEKYKIWQKTGRDKLGIIRSIKEVTRLRGLSLDQYYQMVGRQDNKCDICGKNETRKNKNGDIARLCIDHNHETGKFRSLLCHNCNQVIGHSRESTDILKEAINYLEKHSYIE